jgi:hypothetical protein
MLSEGVDPAHESGAMHDSPLHLSSDPGILHLQESFALVANAPTLALPWWQARVLNQLCRRYMFE